jgi:2-desacetyl-2-hydroxyethyl bacteriochlorophyllide A dehydrogenase
VQSQAILFTAVNEVQVDTVDIPEPGPGELLVRTHYSCISPGTELRCLSGRQAGFVSWPIIPGYALVGEVVRGGVGTTTPPGSLVFCSGTSRASQARLWGGHVAYAVVAEERTFGVPPGIDPVAASLAKLAAIVYHGVRLARPSLDDQVLVIGLGVIGQLAARLYAITGARVVAADVAEPRVHLARAAGIAAYTAQTDRATGLREALPHGADIVVDATGVPDVIPQALELVRPLPWGDDQITGARYVVQGSYPGSFSIPYQAAFMAEVSFLLPRDQQPRDLRSVLDLMRRGKLHVRDLVSDIRKPEQAAETYAELRDPAGRLLTVVFDWRA